MTKWIGHSEFSLDKEKAKRTLIWYAYPEGQRYGYFTSTNKQVWEKFLIDMGSEPIDLSRPIKRTYNTDGSVVSVYNAGD